MMMIENKYDFGDIVYLKTDPQQLPRVVTEIKITSGNIIYVLSLGGVNSEHYEFEISTEKDYVNV